MHTVDELTVAGGAAQQPARPGRQAGHPADPSVAGDRRTSASTSSRTVTITSSSCASTFRRSSGSVFDARRLNHQRGACAQCATVRPSSSSTSTGPAPALVTYASTTRALAAGTSCTLELISPLLTYGSYASASADSGTASPAGVRAVPSAASTCMAASIPVSAKKKSRK